MGAVANALTGAAQSKTIWVSAILAFLGAVMTSSDVLQIALSPKVYGVTMMVIAAIMAALRVVTTDSLAAKGADSATPAAPPPQPATTPPEAPKS